MVVDLLRCGVDGSGGWWLYLTTNGSLSGVALFTELIGFDLGKAAAPHTGGQYGRGPLNLLELTFGLWLVFLHL